MILMKQNERLVEEMPSLMQIQYVLNTLRFFSFIKKTLPLYQILCLSLSGGALLEKNAVRFFSQNLGCVRQNSTSYFLALKETSVQKKLTTHG
jgi:hypothetical protein